MFTNFVSGSTRVLLGYFLIGFFLCFIVYNTIIMLICLCHNIHLLIRRCTTKMRRKHLRKEVVEVSKKIEDTLLDITKDWFVPDDLDDSSD